MKSKTVQILLILGLVLLVRIPDLPYHYMDWDEAAMMSQAWALTQGQSLYRDIWQIHPVLNFAVFYPFFSLLSPDLAPHMIKLLNLILILLGALQIRKMCARWLPDDLSPLLAALTFAFYFAFRWAQSSYGEFYAVFPILIAVDLLFFSGGGTAWKNCFLAGLLGGAAILFKQVAVFDVLGIWLAFLILHEGNRWRKAAGSLWLAAGMAVFFLPVGAALMAKGILRDSLHAMVVSPLTGYTQLVPTEPLSPSGFLLRRLALFSTILLHVAVQFCVPILLAFAGLVGARMVRSGHPSRTVFYALLLWLIVDLLGMACMGRFFPHYQIQLIPAMALLSAYAPSLVPRKARAVFLSGALVVAYALGGFVCVQRLGKSGVKPNRVRVSQEIAAFIRSNTSENDRIFLYRVENLDIFYLAGRLSNNGIYMFTDMFEEHSHDAAAAAERREMFLRNLPRALLVDEGLLLGCESSVGFFQEVVRSHYTRRAVIEGVEIYFLRGDG